MSINRNRGKSAERAVAKIIGGTRVGTMGNEDISSPIWSVEVKERQTFVADSWFQQAVRNCPAGKTPLLVVHIHGKKHDGDYVMMKLSDFQAWFGKVSK